MLLVTFSPTDAGVQKGGGGQVRMEFEVWLHLPTPRKVGLNIPNSLWKCKRSHSRDQKTTPAWRNVNSFIAEIVKPFFQYIGEDVILSHPSLFACMFCFIFGSKLQYFYRKYYSAMTIRCAWVIVLLLATSGIRNSVFEPLYLFLHVISFFS